MPRRRKPARILFHLKDNEYFIHHGPLRQRTGCRGVGSLEAAEKALKVYLASLDQEPPKGAALDEITIGEILKLYADDRAGSVQSLKSLAYSIRPLGEFFGDMKPSEITPMRLKEYTKYRATERTSALLDRKVSAGPATVRHDLGRLVAAINFCNQEGYLSGTVKIKLPEQNAPKDRWLTRTELAWLLRASGSHLKRFIIISYTMGRRKGATLDLKWKEGPGGGWVNIRTEIIHFDDPARPTSNKRRGSAMMPKRLVSHMRRWKKLGGDWVIEWEGNRVVDVKKAFEAACRRAEKMHAEWLQRSGRTEDPLDLSNVTPHVLKHTAITYYFQDGGDLMPAGKYFATSSRTLETIYYNHHPKGQAHIAAKMNRPGRRGEAAPAHGGRRNGACAGVAVVDRENTNTRPGVHRAPEAEVVSHRLLHANKSALERLVWTHPRTDLAASCGMTDRGIAKRCERMGVAQPPRGFWQQVKAGRCPRELLEKNQVKLPDWINLQQLVSRRGAVDITTKGECSTCIG